MHVHRSRYLMQCFDQFNLIRDIYKRFFLLHQRIFDIDANSTGHNHCFDSLKHLFNGIPITCLDICRDRTLDYPRDTSYCLDHHLPAHVLTIAITQGGGHPRTGCGDSTEASLLYNTCASCIPDVWQHKQRRSLMKPPKLCGFLFLCTRTHKRNIQNSVKTASLTSHLPREAWHRAYVSECVSPSCLA